MMNDQTPTHLRMPSRTPSQAGTVAVMCGRFVKLADTVDPEDIGAVACTACLRVAATNAKTRKFTTTQAPDAVDGL